jgi:hypothetical protein
MIAVPRGAAQKPIKEEKLNDRANRIPRTRKGVRDELDYAKTKFLPAVVKHYDKFASQSYTDLELNLENDPSASKADFDNMFFNDRTAALRDISNIERYIRKVRNMMKDEGLRNLEDMSSAFGSIGGDGQVSSCRTWVIQDIGREVRLERPYIEQYLDQIDTENLVSPSQPKSEPDYQHDDD